MNTSPDPDVRVLDAPEHGRYEIYLGDQLAGFTQYDDQGDRRIFPHTQVDEAFSGRGLATQLIGEALDATRALGKEVVPLCPAVRTFIRRHPDYLDLVPEDRRVKLGLGL